MSQLAHAQPEPDETGIAPEHAAAVLTIDLTALQKNWRNLAKQAAPAECAAVVKADAYGLGIGACASALWAAGCRTFFVALPQEGVALRAVVPEAAIHVLDGLLPELGQLYAAHELIPALASLDELAEWTMIARQQGRRLNAALHVDSGINRLGLSRAEVETLAAGPDRLDAIEVTLVLSHLACGDDPGAEMNARQRHTFEDLRALLPHGPASLANSAAVFLGEEFAYDLVRAGVALYGGNPFSHRPNPMAPVAHLYATILQVRHIAVGEAVGYGAEWRAERPSRIGVIGVGYGDGFPRALSRGSPDDPAQVYVAGHFAPVVGRISMDLITIDLTDVPDQAVRRGARVELLGDHITVDDVAHWAGTIPYEILTGLGSRFSRLYSEFESPR